MRVVLHDGEDTERVLAGEAKRISVGLGNCDLWNAVRIFDDETLSELARQVLDHGWVAVEDNQPTGRFHHYCDVED